jgi:hypothetical protein
LYSIQVPDCATSVYAVVVGGGGGSAGSGFLYGGIGSAGSGSYLYGSGGGGGALSFGSFSVSGGETLSVSVGSGGVGASSNFNSYNGQHGLESYVLRGGQKCLAVEEEKEENMQSAFFNPVPPKLIGLELEELRLDPQELAVEMVAGEAMQL